MIEKIVLKNFQCHEKLTVELDPFCTTLVGSSDVGKTAVLRAFKWVSQNHLRGDCFIRHGASRCKVRVRIDNQWVRRSRGDGDNRYQIGNRVYRAFGTGVPKSVADLLNVGDISFQNQFDGPFWFMLSPGGVSRQLNAIINLGAIDDALARIASEVRRSRAAVEVSQKRLSSARQRREELRWARDADEQLTQVEQIGDELQSITEQVDRLDGLIGEVDTAQEHASRLHRIAQDGSRAVQMGSDTLTLTQNAQEAGELVSEIDRLEALVRSEIPDISTLENIRAQHEQVHARYVRLHGLWLGVTQLEHEIQVTSMTLRDTEREIDEVGVCPLCQQPLGVAKR